MNVMRIQWNPFDEQQTIDATNAITTAMNNGMTHTVASGQLYGQHMTWGGTQETVATAWVILSEQPGNTIYINQS